MSNDDEIGDALGFLEREKNAGDLAPSKPTKKPPSLGKWLVRGAFLSMHVLIVALALMWVGYLPTPGTVRSATRAIHEATKPPGEPPVVGPRAGGPQPPRPKPAPARPPAPRVKPEDRIARNSSAKEVVPKAKEEAKGVEADQLKESKAFFGPEPAVAVPPPPRPEDVEEQDPKLKARREALKTALSEHRQKLEASKPSILDGLDRAKATISRLRPIQAAEQALALDRLAKERAAFERAGAMPFSTAMMPTTSDLMKQVIAYQDLTQLTRRRAITACELLAKDLFAANRHDDARAVTQAQGVLDEEVARVSGFADGSLWEGGPFTVLKVDAFDRPFQGTMGFGIKVGRFVGDRFSGELRFGNGSVARIEGLFNGVHVQVKTGEMIREVGHLRNYDLEGIVSGGVLRGAIKGFERSVANGEITRVAGDFEIRLVPPR